MTYSRNDIAEYISNSSEVKKLYRLAMNCGFWPDFPDHQIESLDAYLEAAKIGTISEVDNLISENFHNIESFVAEIYSHRKNGWRWRLSSTFLCELILIYKFPNIFDLEFLAKNNWDDDIARIILTAAKKNS